MSVVPEREPASDCLPGSEDKQNSVQRGRSFEPSWVAAVRSTADRLHGELLRAARGRSPADHEIAREEISRARCQADRPALKVGGRIRQLWRRTAAWWTGYDVDRAWTALHTASEALLIIEDPGVVKSQLGDMAAAVVTALNAGDIRAEGYLNTLELLAKPGRDICEDDREQLRAIREVCNDSFDAAHGDARVYRNTLIQLGSLLAIVLAVVAIIALGDKGFRSVFSGPKTTPGPWYILELELVASLGGLTSAVLTLQNYTGFQFTYGLPFVQAFLKGTTGAATGLLGVLLVQSGIVSSLKPQTGGAVFATAIIFGSAQYLFTRIVDQQAKSILGQAGSRNDPDTNPKVPPGARTPALNTTLASPGSGPVVPPGAPTPGTQTTPAPPGSGPVVPPGADDPSLNAEP
jgi:hypothetical protein